MRRWWMRSQQTDSHWQLPAVNLQWKHHAVAQVRVMRDRRHCVTCFALCFPFSSRLALGMIQVRLVRQADRARIHGVVGHSDGVQESANLYV